MAKKRRKRRLKKWVKTVLAIVIAVLTGVSGWTVWSIYVNAAMDTEYRYVFEKPLVKVDAAIAYDMEGGIFYRQNKNEEERTPVTNKSLVVSEDGENFHEIRTDENGRLITGWYEGKDGRYFYTPEHGWLVTESGEIDGRYYKLDENGRVYDKEWVKEQNGVCWYIDGQKAAGQEDTLLYVEGEKGFYYLQADKDFARAEGTEITLADGRLLIYDDNGKIITTASRDLEGRAYCPVPESYEVAQETKTVALSDLVKEIPDMSVRCVNHRGYHVSAPENSLTAYKQSYEQGYAMVECDIQFTADGIPVLLHNETINAVARNMDGSLINGQVHVSGLTFEELMNYDFGIICGEAYRGLRVTTLEEFLAFCKAYGIHPYLEMKGETVDTQDEVDFLLAMVDSYGMRGNVTWISFSSDPLRYVINRDPEARIGYLIAARSDLNYIVSSVSSLRAQGYNAFIDAVFTASEALAPLCQNAGVPLEVWTVNSEAYIRTLNPYISGITTDVLHVEY
ncbi:MAG: glycerophosphodiester phosphodiesterase family protein [Erysipelotrichaceae bacterium]|nr:glycerophosphodiester phosphodiesterase family protein [Erysipelotrichaceae bacterium]